MNTTPDDQSLEMLAKDISHGAGRVRRGLSVRLFTSPACLWSSCSTGHSGSLRCVVFVRACCVGNSRVSERAWYWQLSPSPWAGGAAGCVGRGYTCSGPVRPRCRCTSRLRPVPSCRFASPPPGWGTEPAQSERIRFLLKNKSGNWMFMSSAVDHCCHPAESVKVVMQTR